MDVKIIFEVIENGGNATVAKRICKEAGSQGVTGIFVPDGMAALSEVLKSTCTEIPVEDVSSDLFPTIWD
jgi:hypothetical protein